MRALLLVNRTATTTTARTRDVLVSALGRGRQLEVAETKYRGHATALARQAARDCFGLVVALGGDGTVNEAVNGLLSAGSRTDPPDLAVVPGGSTNVFARALGLPRDPVEATGAVLQALRAGSRRVVPMARADERYFTFCAGMGLDAEVIRAVDGLRASGYRSTPLLYVWAALHHFFVVTDRRRPALTLERSDNEPVPGLFLGVVQNTAPWTYVGHRPVDPNPRADFDTGLDLFALRRLRTLATLNAVRQFLHVGRDFPRGRHILSLHDATEFTLRASRPIAFQTDGEYLGERESVTFHSASATLRIVV
ncbi:MAG: diacylglycerol kinase family lipid kinase [Streptosporangiales bacterium]|nr:diacylglycerol kinase family lipid kinase [Streptosporangiales bacterium]